MYPILAGIHGVFWLLVVLVGLAGLLKTVLSMIGKTAPASLDFNLYRAYSAALSLQVLLGLILILLRLINGGLETTLLIHAVLMLLAIGAAQGLGAGARRRSDDAGKLQALLLTYGISLLILVVGISVAFSRG